MRAIQLSAYVKGPRDLTVTTVADPTPSPTQYLIRVHAAATNFFDLLQIQGKYQTQPPFPWISGAEFAGEILSIPTAAGKTTPRFRVGDRVFGSAQGGYAQLVCAHEAGLQPVPEGWSFSEAAGLFVTMPTAYAALVTRADVKAGEWVLVHAAAGGVGLAAVQIAKALGATVVATAGTAAKLDVARRFGADHVVNYRDADWPAQVAALTPKKRGVDVVYDPVGLIEKSTKCIAWNGRLVVIGFVGGQIEKLPLNRVLLKNIAVMGLFWGAYAKNQPEKVPEVWARLQELMRTGKVRNTNYADQRYTRLEDVPAALEALGGRETWGKVVVDVPQEVRGKL